MFKKKQDQLFTKSITDFWAFLTVIIALAAFFTGKTDLNSFFEGITISNFLITFIKTFVAYAVTLTVIIMSAFIIIDFPLLIFGVKFQISNFLYGTIFSNVVLNWWWNDSISQNIFLSAVIIYFLANYDIVTKKNIYSLIYKKVGNHFSGFSISVIIKHRRKLEGIHIGLLIIQKVEEDFTTESFNPQN